MSVMTEVKRRSFSAFRTAREEVDDRSVEWDESVMNLSATGRIILTPSGLLPYKVVLVHFGGARTEHAFATIRECEAFIRKRTPPPPDRCTIYDHSSNES